MSEHPNVTTVNSMTQAILTQDHDALAKVFTDDLVFHYRAPVPATGDVAVPSSGDYTGVGGLLEVIGAVIEATDGQVDLDQQFCVGAGRWAAEFEHATLGRNGSTLESENAFVYRFDGDRISEMWMFIGALPEPAEAFFS